MNHKEAFALMWYACVCGHQERYWNSRDGVTPFGTCCPSCGGSSLLHVRWREDKVDPHHAPHRGQRIWVDMTREQAKAIAERVVALANATGRRVPDGYVEKLAASYFAEGAQPMEQITP